jgi:hypothetical protein
MTFESDSWTVFRRIVARLLFPILVVAVAAWRDNSGPSTHQIGSRAIYFDRGRAPTFLAVDAASAPERIAVLDSGLEEGRGVAFANDHVYFADAWDAIFICQLRPMDTICQRAAAQARGLKSLPALEVCPQGECAAVEHGGIRLYSGMMYVSDPHRRRVMVYRLDREDSPDPPDAFGDRILGNVHDVAVIDGSQLVVAQSAPSAQPDSPRASTATGPDAKAGVYVLNSDRTKALQVITNDVTHPVGVAYSPINGGRVYVADIAAGRETWRYFDHNATGWKEQGVIWSEALRNPEDWPRLQSIVVAPDDTREAIFAAAPDGLYLLEPEEGLLAKYVIGGPVAGLSWASDNRLVMTVGRRLATLNVAPKRAYASGVLFPKAEPRSVPNSQPVAQEARAPQSRKPLRPGPSTGPRTARAGQPTASSTASAAQPCICVERQADGTSPSDKLN